MFFYYSKPAISTDLPSFLIRNFGLLSRNNIFTPRQVPLKALQTLNSFSTALFHSLPLPATPSHALFLPLTLSPSIARVAFTIFICWFSPLTLREI